MEEMEEEIAEEEIAEMAVEEETANQVRGRTIRGLITEEIMEEIQASDSCLEQGWERIQ